VVNLDRIYTRGGDAGETSLGDGRRVSKADARIAAYGAVDELGAVLGVVRTLELPDGWDAWLGRIQNDLFDLGADLAVPLASERGRKRERLRIGEPHVAALESACDAYNERVAPLTSFVLSGGTPQAATLHHARTVCRRAERHVIRLGAREDVGGPTIAYLNRLSDLLFLLARVHNDEGRADVLWEPGGSLPKD